MVTVAGELTVMPPKVHAVARPEVLNCVVRFTELPKQALTDLSMPRFGFGVTVIVSRAVSEQLDEFIAINW